MSCYRQLGGLCCLQDEIEMRNEYRLFVVDGEIVSGTGRVDEATPLDRVRGSGLVFDPAMREHRDERGPVRRDAAKAVRFGAEGARIVADILTEPGFPRSFVLDLFADGDGAIGVVELNPLLPSGLYANDARAIAGALIDQTARYEKALAVAS